MATKKEMLDFLYDNIANKELTMGCIIYCDDHFDGTTPEVVYSAKEYKDGIHVSTDTYGSRYRKIKYVRGHPIMVGDFLEWLPKGPDFFDHVIPVVDLWVYLSQSIDVQPKETIKFMYDLAVKAKEQKS